MTVVAGAYTMKQHRTLLLHRTQTEEWKGWMQVRNVPIDGAAGGPCRGRLCSLVVCPCQLVVASSPTHVHLDA